MSIFTAAANDEDGDTIKQLREENEQLRQSLQAANYMLVKVSKAGAHYARAASCLRETVIRWAARAEQAEEMLEAIGAGGVGKMEQPKREPLTEEEIAYCIFEARLGAEGAFKRNGSSSYRIARAIERAHGIGGDA